MLDLSLNLPNNPAGRVGGSSLGVPVSSIESPAATPTAGKKRRQTKIQNFFPVFFFFCFLDQTLLEFCYVE